LDFSVGPKAPNGERIKMESGVPKHTTYWHTVLVPGPPEDAALVKRIFKMFVRDGKTPTEIAALFNRQGRADHEWPPWRGSTVRYILRNEVYSGPHHSIERR